MTVIPPIFAPTYAYPEGEVPIAQQRSSNMIPKGSNFKGILTAARHRLVAGETDAACPDDGCFLGEKEVIATRGPEKVGDLSESVNASPHVAVIRRSFLVEETLLHVRVLVLPRLISPCGDAVGVVRLARVLDLLVLGVVVVNEGASGGGRAGAVHWELVEVFAGAGAFLVLSFRQSPVPLKQGFDLALHKGSGAV